MPAPRPLVDRTPTRPDRFEGVQANLDRLTAHNAYLLVHLGRKPRSPLWSAWGIAAIPASVLIATLPMTARGPVAVALVGIAAWRCAAATTRTHRRARPGAANDNPPRPRLPPSALRW